MKEFIEVDTLQINPDFDFSTEYSVEAIKETAEKRIAENSWNLPEGTAVTKFTLRVEKEWDHEYCSVDLYIIFYRTETDDEKQSRLEAEETARLRLEAIDKERAVKQAAADKRKKELEADPDYSKFVELKKKFKS